MKTRFILPLTTAKALNNWLWNTEPIEVENTLLALRAELIHSIDGGMLEECRKLLERVLLPALQDSSETYFPLLIAFRLVHARVTANSDQAFQSVIEAAEKLNLYRLAARGVIEWAHWKQQCGQVIEADQLYQQAQDRFQTLGMSEVVQQIYINRARLASCRLDWPDAVQLILSWLGQSLQPSVAGHLHLEVAQCCLRASNAIAADEHLDIAKQFFNCGTKAADAFGCHLTQAYRSQWFWQQGAYDRALEELLDPEDRCPVDRWFRDHGYAIEADITAANRASIWLVSHRNLGEAMRELERLCHRFRYYDPLLWWQLTMNLAASHERLGDFSAAARLYSKLQGAGRTRQWETKLAGLNLAHLRINARIENGLEVDLEAALEDQTVRQDAFLFFLALENMGDWHSSAYRHEAASAYYRKALECIERARVRLPWEFLRRQLRQAYRRIFNRLETALLAQQAWEASWQVADRAKGQSFTDFLEGPYPPLDRQSRLAFLRTRRNLDNAYRHRKGDVERLEYLLDQTLADSKRDFKRDYDPERAPFPWRQWPALQGRQTALVEFSRCSQGLGAYLVRDGQVRYQALQSLPETEEMYDRITEWWDRQQDWLHRYQEAINDDDVQATTSTDASSQPWVQLLLDWLTTERQRWQVETGQWTRRLLIPLAAELQGVQRLLVVPDGALSLLPWSGLWDEEQAEYLRDRFAEEIRVLPGSRIGQLLSQRKPAAAAAPTLVARPSYSDSDLLCTELEARWVSSQLGKNCRLLEEGQVTHAALRRLLPQCRWFHYAGHGEFRQHLLLASHLKLAKGQHWTGWDMLAFPLQATTVILSACEVGSVEEAEAGEWFGLLRGFFLAGARTVVAPLWEMTDLGSLALIQAFYQHAATSQGGNLASALTLAQLQSQALGDWACLALKNCAVGSDFTWQEVLAPVVSPLLQLASVVSPLLQMTQAELAQCAIALLRAAMALWRQRIPGRYANDRQCKEQVWSLLEELSLLSHPLHWSSFQLYGEPLNPLAADLTR